MVGGRTDLRRWRHALRSLREAEGDRGQNPTIWLARTPRQPLARAREIASVFPVCETAETCMWAVFGGEERKSPLCLAGLREFSRQDRSDEWPREDWEGNGGAAG